jgi:hypothetical protein
MCFVAMWLPKHDHSSRWVFSGRLRIWKTPELVHEELALLDAETRESGPSCIEATTSRIVERQLVEHGYIIPEGNYFALRCVGTTLMTASMTEASLWGELVKFSVNCHK